MSLARSAQAITDDHEERIQTLEDIVARLTRIEEAQNRMLASLDEDRPTVLRKLNRERQKYKKASKQLLEDTIAALNE